MHWECPNFHFLNISRNRSPSPRAKFNRFFFIRPNRSSSLQQCNTSVFTIWPNARCSRRFLPVPSGFRLFIWMQVATTFLSAVLIASFHGLIWNCRTNRGNHCAVTQPPFELSPITRNCLFWLRFPTMQLPLFIMLAVHK